MSWREATKLANEDIKKAIVFANNEQDQFRVDYLKYCRRQIKAKLVEFKRNN